MRIDFFFDNTYRSSCTLFVLLAIYRAKSTRQNAYKSSSSKEKTVFFIINCTLKITPTCMPNIQVKLSRIVFYLRCMCSLTIQKDKSSHKITTFRSITETKVWQIHKLKRKYLDGANICMWKRQINPIERSTIVKKNLYIYIYIYTRRRNI